MTKAKSELIRIPSNKSWERSDVSGPAEKTNDQQYHYDRIIKYMNETNSLVDDIDSIRKDPKIFAAEVNKGMKSGISKLGCLPETSLAAVSDYINNFLLD